MSFYLGTTLLATALLAVAIYWLDKFAALNETLIEEAKEAQDQADRALDFVASLSELVDDEQLKEAQKRVERSRFTVVP